MYSWFRQQLANAPLQGVVVIELSTLGGDPEVARMMGVDVAHFLATLESRSAASSLLGSAAIYSAGTRLQRASSPAPTATSRRGTRLDDPRAAAEEDALPRSTGP